VAKAMNLAGQIGARLSAKAEQSDRISEARRESEGHGKDGGRCSGRSVVERRSSANGIRPCIVPVLRARR
jgi:hypothetical protein